MRFVVFRMSWGGLVTHAFWQGSLQHLTQDLESNEAIVSMRESVRQSIANFSIRASSQADLPKGNSVLGKRLACDHCVAAA